jgi:hypothetical protein
MGSVAEAAVGERFHTPPWAELDCSSAAGTVLHCSQEEAGSHHSQKGAARCLAHCSRMAALEAPQHSREEEHRAVGRSHTLAEGRRSPCRRNKHWRSAAVRRDDWGSANIQFVRPRFGGNTCPVRPGGRAAGSVEPWQAQRA